MKEEFDMPLRMHGCSWPCTGTFLWEGGGSLRGGSPSVRA